MTIHLNPDQEQAIRAAIRDGQVASVEELIDRALAGLQRHKGSEETWAASGGRSIFDQGLGLFGSPEDSRLLDEAVSIAYEERHRPTRREPTL